MLQTNQGGEYTAQTVPSRDDVRVGIDLQDFFVELQSRLIIPVWLPHLASDTLVVASISTSHTVTTLFPPIRAALAAATRAKQVVVILIVARGPISFEHGDCSTLHGKDDCTVAVVAEHVTPDATVVPPEWNG